MSKAIFMLALVATAAAVCPYSCSTTNAAETTGTGCLNATGELATGADSTSVCATGYYPAESFTCSDAAANVTTAINCTNDINGIDAANYVAGAAAIGNGFSLPGACSCVAGAEITCTRTNDNSPTCTNCDLPCNLDALVTRQALTATAGAVCPQSVDTLSEAKDCFEQAACAGAINPSVDTCVYGNDLTCHSGPCPECPSSSKKGLLGLLGLLGLIPLLLCSLLCCLLLCIRRRKVERDVHFATFDAGAPAIAAPVCADVPVASHYQTVHHQTYVGPEHCDQFGGIAPMGPVGAPVY